MRELKSSGASNGGELTGCCTDLRIRTKRRRIGNGLDDCVKAIYLRINHRKEVNIERRVCERDPNPTSASAPTENIEGSWTIPLDVLEEHDPTPFVGTRKIFISLPAPRGGPLVPPWRPYG